MGIRRPGLTSRFLRKQRGDTSTPAPPLYGNGTGAFGGLVGYATSDDDAIYPGDYTFPGAGLFPGGPPLGGSFLADTLSPYARLAVEIAFGADPTGDPDEWTWTDVTTDVRQDTGVDIKVGKTDEASKAQPATLRLTLDNNLGAYSRGSYGPNHPYVRRGVPVRISVNLGENLDNGALPGRPPGLYPGLALVAPQRTFRTRFIGLADGFTPKWDPSGTDATSELEASGILRRLGQGNSPLPSPARRAIPAVTGLLAYWPLEDDKFATTAASAVSGVPAMGVVGGPPVFASTVAAKTAAFSDPVMQVHDATLVGVIPAYTDTNQVQVRFMISMTDEGTYADDSADLITFYTTGTVSKWTVYLGLGSNTGAVGMFGIKANSAISTTTLGPVGDVIDRPTLISVDLVQTGANFTVRLSPYYPNAPEYTYYENTVTAETFGRITRVVVHGNPTSRGSLDKAFLGHLYVSSLFNSKFNTPFGINAGETAAARLTRLGTENSIPLTTHGATISSLRMGQQTSRKLVDLLQECETVEQGVLVDGIGQGLDFFTHTARENQTAALTLDAERGQLAKEFTPVDDDQTTRNQVAVKRTGGGTATVTDTDGPLGVAQVGLYDDSVTVNTNSDDRLDDYAAWLVHQGTHDGFRYPQVSIDLAKNPELAPAWAVTLPTNRVTVTNARHKRTQLPDDTVDLAIVGYRETISRFRWNVTMNCAPYDPWRVAKFASSTSDTDELVLRAETDGSLLPAGADEGDTTLTVHTPSGTLWTTAAEDFPMVLDIGGFPVVVAACTDVDATTQTFTVGDSAGGYGIAPYGISPFGGSNQVTQTIPAGASVDLWRPPVPGL